MSQEIRIGVAGMTCASCVARVERAIARQPGVESAAVNLAAQTAVVRFDRAEIPQLLDAVRGAGYEPVVSPPPLRPRHDLRLLRGAGGAGIRALPGVIEATVNLSTESATVAVTSRTLSRERIAQAIREAGYEPRARRAQRRRTRPAGRARPRSSPGCGGTCCSPPPSRCRCC